MSATALDPGAIAAKYGALASTPPPQTPSGDGTSSGQDAATVAAKYGALNVDSSGQVTNSDDEASRTRQMLVSGLTGMPTPNMTDADKASFYRGKAAGAISVPIVAGATLGGTAAAEAAPTIVEKAGEMAEWAKANKLKALIIEGIAHEMGVDPFQLLHKVVKYGKGLFGGDDSSK